MLDEFETVAQTLCLQIASLVSGFVSHRMAKMNVFVERIQVIFGEI